MKHLTYWIALLAAPALAGAQEPSMQIRCEIRMPESLQLGQPAELVFELTNTGKDVVRVLQWQTPFEGIQAPMFDITRDGLDVAYRGRMLKRSAPKKEDYLVLKSGQQREARIRLEEAWDVEPAGRYTVEYAAELFDVIEGSASAPRALDDFEPVTLDCNSVTFTRGR